MDAYRLRRFLTTRSDGPVTRHVAIHRALSLAGAGGGSLVDADVDAIAEVLGAVLDENYFDVEGTDVGT